MSGPTQKTRVAGTGEYADETSRLSSSEVLGCSVGIDGSKWVLELVDETGFSSLGDEISQLSDKTRYPNLFFITPFLEPASRYLTKEKVRLLCLFEITGGQRSLKLFAPVTQTRVGVLRHRVLRVWSHSFAPLSAPLMDSLDEQKVVEEFSKCLETIPANMGRAILFEDLPILSGFSKLIQDLPGVSDNVCRFGAKTRASVRDRSGIEDAVKNVSGKRKQRLRRAREQLERFGVVTFEKAATLPQVKDALKNHLRLESAGWKGSRQTSILQHEGVTCFANQTIEALTQNGNCSIYTLQLNSCTIASMILLHTSGHYYPWKITYDETYAKQSVGNLLLVHVNEAIRRDSEFLLLDSLASELNKTARRFWPDELETSHLVIGLGQKGPKIARHLAVELEAIAKLKRTIKSWLGRSL